MVRICLICLLLGLSIYPLLTNAQKIDSIAFHLYTDSLKKGQHNYINVDGKMSNGKWLPLTANEIIFSCPEAPFEGNELIIPEAFAPRKVTVKAVLKQDPRRVIEQTIWIRQTPDPPLPAREELDRKQKRRK